MMGEEGKPGKKIKVKGRVKRPDRPPENPVVDVSRSVLADQQTDTPADTYQLTPPPVFSCSPP